MFNVKQSSLAFAGIELDTKSTAYPQLPCFVASNGSVHFTGCCGSYLYIGLISNSFVLKKKKKKLK